MRLVDLAAKGTHLRMAELEFKLWFPDFKSKTLKTISTTTIITASPKSLYMTVSQWGRPSYTVLMGVEGSISCDRGLIITNSSHREHLFLQCLKHAPNDWAQVLTHYKTDDVTASSLGIFPSSCHCLAYGQQEWKWIWITAAANIHWPFVICQRLCIHYL